MSITDEFKIYTAPTGESLKELWSEGIFVFDTSALLNFYYFSKSSRTEIFEKTLTPIKEKLWIPQHVMYEYQKNREETIKKPILEKYQPVLASNIKPISKTIKEIDGNLNNIKDLTKNSDSHPYIEGNINEEFVKIFLDFKSQFEKYEKSVEVEFKKRESEISSLLEEDDVLNYIKTNFKVGNGYTFLDIMKLIQQEGELRYRNQIPPGYKDAQDKIGTQKYGDLIIWKQILSYAKDQKKPVIYITNDVKPDWCYKVKHDSETRIDKPREELIKEFYDFTDSRFWMYTVKQFLYYHQEVFSTIINQKVLDEATLVNANNKQKFKLEINTGSVAKALDFFNNNIYRIGNILSIKHFRNKEEVIYVTEIIGDNGELRINGGISSGYKGAGPNGFIRLLSSLNIDADTAAYYVYGDKTNIHSFEIPISTISETQNSLSNNNDYSTCPICGSNNWNGTRCMTCGNMDDD